MKDKPSNLSGFLSGLSKVYGQENDKPTIIKQSENRERKRNRTVVGWMIRMKVYDSVVKKLITKLHQCRGTM